MRLPRKDPLLNDAIEEIDKRFFQAKHQLPKGSLEDHVALAWNLCSPIELEFIAEQLDLCVSSRVHYLVNFHVLQPESGVLTCFRELYDHQWMVEEAIAKERAATGQSKVIVCKPRQAGITEYSIGVMCQSTFFTPNAYTVSVAQAPDVAAHAQRKLNIAYNGLPWWMRPERQYHAKGEYMEFNRKDLAERFTNPGLGSVFVTTHAQRSTGIAIGRTLRNLHMTEVSRWASTEVYTADLEPSMNAADTNAICESTGLGDNGLYYNMWLEAIEGDSDWIPVFLPAYRARKFSLPLKPSQRPFILTPEEIAIKERAATEEHFAVKDEFFNWRRRRIKSSIKRTGFDYAHRESYPTRWQESFQSSGLNYLPRHKLDLLQQSVRNPSWVGEVLFKGLHAAPKLVGETNPPDRQPEKRTTTNRLWVWEAPNPNVSYYIGADTGAGIRDGDFQVAQVLRAGVGLNPDVQVAEWVGWEAPKEFARKLYALGFLYNKAEIAAEYAKEGMITCNYLANDLEYPNIYRPRSEDRIGKQLASYLHWQTTSKSKSQMGGTMIEAMLEDSFRVNSKYLMNEFYKLAKDGATYSGLGEHDDAAIACLISLFCLRQTMPELRSPAHADDAGQQMPIRSARPSGGPAAVIYGLFDQYTRMRGQSTNLAAAEQEVAARPGWFIKPIPVSKVNTAYSIIQERGSVENDLWRNEGMRDWDITPGVTAAWRGARSADQGAEAREFSEMMSGGDWPAD